ncbi:MAG: SMC family ATPase [Chloroflexota bacterium]
MIPIKLAVRNFMPYRDKVPPLDFAGIHTASIWGENGSGKSALIEAMTWALWGKTRAKSDDDLIHQGQNEMEVEFDFSVGQETYRVIRKHTRPKRQRGSGQSSLDLLIASPSQGKDDFKVLSGTAIRETEQKIRDTLHMDYKTFNNSAYLSQGHADEFTIATAAERKQVLTDILGLSLYDQLEEQAKELAKQQEIEKAQAESAIKLINDELAQKPACEAQLAQARSELAQIEKLIADGESRLNELRSFKEGLDNKQQQLTQLEKHVTETARTLARENERIKQHRARIKEYEELISRRASIEEGYAQLIETRKLSEELNRKLALVEKLNRRKYELNRAIDQVQAAIVTEHKLAESRINELEAAEQKLPQLKTELQQAEAALSQLAGEAEILKQKRESEQQLRTLIHSLESDTGRLKKDIAEIDEKLGLLATQTGAVCPLCERELGEDHRRLIETKYADDKGQKSEAITSKQDELARKQTELQQAASENLHTEQRLQKVTPEAQRMASLFQQGINSAYESLKQMDEERKRLEEIEVRLASKAFAAGEQENLHQLESELARLSYDPQQYDEVRQRLASLEQWEKPRQKLEEADRLIGQEKEAASSAEQAAQELSHSLEADSQKRQALGEDLKMLPQLADDLARAEAEHQRLNGQQKQGQETVGSLKGKLEHFSDLEVKAKEKEKSFSQASKEEVIYRELTQAFGKKGIQAWLIEIALPEIELEADKLLSRMTDNRMHIKIETQRQTKAGDTAETLDIKIADERGTRPYEQFSGGEAFRINFAIRIALSKLLARRAGAPLPTLIIDEGFGTQDTSGLEKLKEAIISIQDDFKMILVITHVEELRDAFPTRIDVIKTAEGSTIEVG